MLRIWCAVALLWCVSGAKRPQGTPVGRDVQVGDADPEQAAYFRRLAHERRLSPSEQEAYWTAVLGPRLSRVRFQAPPPVARQPHPPSMTDGVGV